MFALLIMKVMIVILKEGDNRVLRHDNRIYGKSSTGTYDRFTLHGELEDTDTRFVSFCEEQVSELLLRA